MPRVGDHYRPRGESVEGPVDAPVYRVVGTGENVTLLRVTDGDGRRVSSGELRHVAVDALDVTFEPARNPDAGLTPVRDVRNALSGLYWQFRKFL